MILWVHLLCKENGNAQPICKDWLGKTIGFDQTYIPTLASIKFVANGEDESQLKWESMAVGDVPQMKFLLGVVALSKSDRERALRLFTESLKDGDARNVTQFARAFRDRLTRELSAEGAKKPAVER